jgi:hypothetical protein
MWVLGFWIVTQFVMVQIPLDDGIAWWAHIGGLAAGAVLSCSCAVRAYRCSIAASSPRHNPVRGNADGAALTPIRRTITVRRALPGSGNRKPGPGRLFCFPPSRE